VASPRVELFYPASDREFSAWFSTDAGCLDYLEWLRWPEGFVCLSCQHGGGWRLSDGRFMCAACAARTSVTAGTMFDRTRIPLSVWFVGFWLVANDPDGVSALNLQHRLHFGSYQTAWAMLRRLRSVQVHPDLDRLSGIVEIGESLMRGTAPVRRGGRGQPRHPLVGIAVERVGSTGLGWCRIGVLADGSSASLRAFLTDHVEEGSTVVTDGRQSHRDATAGRYHHERLTVSRRQAAALLPGVHRVGSLAQRWLAEPDHASARDSAIGVSLEEFASRFNHRRSRSQGLVFYRMLQRAVTREPMRYRELIGRPPPAARPSALPRVAGHPAKDKQVSALRPWRDPDLLHSG